MKYHHHIDGVSSTPVASAVVPTPVNSVRGGDTFSDSSSEHTSDDDGDIPFDINHIPNHSIYGLHTYNGCRSDDDDSSFDDEHSMDTDDDQYVPFDADIYSDGAHGSMYMKPPSPSPKNQRSARKHQKKKLGKRSRHTRPSKLNMITPLPDGQIHSNYHSIKYERK